MQTFKIKLTADAMVEGSLDIEADTLQEARNLALKQAREGNIVWAYEGSFEDTIKVDA